MRAVCAIAVALWLVGPVAAQQAPTTIGASGRLEGVVLPGSELEPKPVGDRLQPVVVQWVSATPNPSGGYRYEIAYHGLEAGSFDLRNYLRRKDGSATADLPPVPVTVAPIRPPGQVDVNPVSLAPSPEIGGYRKRLIALGAIWAIGFVAIVASHFFPRRRVNVAAEVRPLTLADRLRPLVEHAAAGTLPAHELADLERMLFALWRGRLNLNYAAPGTAMAALREHAEAGPLLAKLEEWLHSPGESRAVDVGALLAPYRSLPADAPEFEADLEKAVRA